jgi:hypothetical protein
MQISQIIITGLVVTIVLRGCHHGVMACRAKAEELLLPPRDHSSDSSSLSSFSCMQGTLSDEKEFSGLIIGSANAALLL